MEGIASFNWSHFSGVVAEARRSWVENFMEERWRLSIDNSFKKFGCKREMSSWVVAGYLYTYGYPERHEHNCMLQGEGEVKDVGKQRIYWWAEVLAELGTEEIQSTGGRIGLEVGRMALFLLKLKIISFHKDLWSFYTLLDTECSSFKSRTKISAGMELTFQKDWSLNKSKYMQTVLGHWDCSWNVLIWWFLFSLWLMEEMLE